jgi:hypothetical protein
MNKKQINKEAKNKMFQAYLATSSNFAVCIDITSLEIYGELFLAVDLAARTVVGHCYNSNHIDTQQVCETIEQFVRKRSFLPSFQLLHSDRGSIFSNQEFYDCLEKLNIQKSRGSAEAHQNQVVERLNRTIKDILRKQICPQWKKDVQDPLKISHPEIRFEHMADFIKASIEKYNQKEHSALYGLSPNQMEEALFNKHRDKHPIDIPLQGPNDQSEKSLMMQTYKKQIVEQYNGDWEQFLRQHLQAEYGGDSINVLLQFFYDWRVTQEAQHEVVVKQLKINQKIAEENEKNAREAYATLYDQFLEMQKMMKKVSNLDERNLRKFENMIDNKYKNNIS